MRSWKGFETAVASSGARIIGEYIDRGTDEKEAGLLLVSARQKFDAVPFFWSQHYDVPINYVGHAESWDELTIEGDITARDCVVRYKSRGQVRAIASIYRDVDSLVAEAEMERATT